MKQLIQQTVLARQRQQLPASPSREVRQGQGQERGRPGTQAGSKTQQASLAFFSDTEEDTEEEEEEEEEGRLCIDDSGLTAVAAVVQEYVAHVMLSRTEEIEGIMADLGFL